MWKDSIRNIVVIFQTTILGIVGFYVRRSASVGWTVMTETIVLFINGYASSSYNILPQCAGAAAAAVFISVEIRDFIRVDFFQGKKVHVILEFSSQHHRTGQSVRPLWTG